jgi:ribosomal-protein-alanine N-acetyltransferase
MEAADIDSVMEIERASFTAPWRRDHFLHEIAAPHSFPLVAMLEGRLAGYVCLMSLFEEAQILDIAVTSELRGRGVAVALMASATALAVEKGAETLALEVRSTNSAAIALYERLGFRRSGLRTRYYEGIDDALLMEKHLQGESSCSSHP